MTKLIKGILGAVIALLIISAGVWAMVTENLEFGGRITFSTDGVAVNISGTVHHGLTKVDEYSYDYATQSAPANWSINAIALTKTNNVITYCLVFTNIGLNNLNITITRPTNIPAEFSFTGGLVSETDRNADSVTIAGEEEAEFVYVLTLNEFLTAQDFNASFAVAVAETV